ncbi:HIT family protein [Streptococcus oricebi]|uniref:HIT family protein n=1 Tax=Streptococcus oricebi TaxID=1547447 RepID=A0ABS5B3X0_9STRE|nr:HIT family protein [Streptococcus oricebi]MBP2623520.1 HIT family protein [Streptococcus oricebi]
MTDCIFCKIVDGEIPAAKVYEDQNLLAFLDISQVTPGHTLLIPKKHVRNVLEMDAVSASQLFEAVPDLARKIMKATGALGMNIINNNEEVAGQTVFHAHVHLAPRYGADDDLKISFLSHEPDFEKLASLAEKIQQTEV